MNLLLEHIFVMIVRRAVADGLIASGLLYALQNGRLGAVLNGIYLEPDAPWNVEKLASLANMSRSKFAACFARTMRMTPMGYVNAWRMKVAQDLLREGVPIKIIAESVGYSAQASFSKSFLNVVGCPPAEWLKRQASAQEPVLNAHVQSGEGAQGADVLSAKSL